MKFQPNSFYSDKTYRAAKNCIYLCNKGNNLKNKNARVMVLVHNMSSECASKLYEVKVKYLLYYQVIVRIRNSIANDQRETTPKLSKAELWFLCMTHCALEV